ncbi:11351_t:CDS:1, partial [Funneliformis geosporum]
REKNSRTHVISEMITSNAIASITLPSLSCMTSEKIVNASQTIPAEVPAFPQPNKTVIPYDARAPYINVALKEYPYLSLFNSDIHNDGYEFKNSGLCPRCGKEHNKGK